MEFKIKNIEEWQGVIDKILPELRHSILLLKGNLGAGKTSFTKLLLQNLGSKDEVSSPTYAIVNEYDSPKGLIYHFDLYRLKSVQEVFEIGFEEYLDRAFLCIIEWPEIYEEELEDLSTHELKIETADQMRLIKFK